MQCPNCNQRNYKKSKFCINCGQDLWRGEQGEKEEDWEEDRGNGSGRQPSQQYRASSPLETGPSVVDMLKERFESPEELNHGQAVVIAARWILVGAGLLLALWNPDALGELRVQIMLILGLAVGNFFLHSQVLMKKPVSAPVAYAASAADIAVISLIVIAGGGFHSGTYVFFFPALLGLSVAFRTEVTYTLAGAAIVLYGLIALPALAGTAGAVLATRLLMMAAIAVCGNVYWRSERDRRRAAVETRDELVNEVRQAAAAR